MKGNYDMSFNDLKLKYFKESEFKMGSKIVADEMNSDFLLKIDLLRSNIGFAMVMSSCYRTEEYCLLKKIKYLQGSFHNVGRAVDIKISNYTAEKRVKIVKEAIKLGLTVGVSKYFIHLDDRETQTIYGY